MTRILIQCVACLLIVSMLVSSSGCFGSFNLTKKVYNFNKGVGDKWIQELVFLVMIIVPVYGVASFIDIIILNVVEFWTGKNPMTTATLNDESMNVTMSLDGENNTVHYVQNSPDQQSEYLFERNSDGTLVKDRSGKVIFICQATDDGGIVIKDASGKVTATYSPDDIQSLYNTLAGVK